jgi:phosphoglycolate phosphatase-like HAD superfamily hydrolase
VLGTVNRLRKAGVLLAVATGDDREPTMETLSLLGITEDVAMIVCGDDPLPEKPDSAVLQSIAAKLGISTEHMLMVGVRGPSKHSRQAWHLDRTHAHGW